MRKALLLSLILVALTTQVAAAQTVGFSVETAQEVYRPGDTILVTANVYNNYNYEVDVIVECLVIDETATAASILVSYPVALGPGESETVTLHQAYVAEDSPSGEYRAAATLIVENIFQEEREITFRVEDTLEPMSFKVRVSMDSEGENESRVFVLGDRIYMSYQSPIDGVQISASITHPDMSKQDITLPTVLEAREIGSYALLATASSEGYRSETREVDFAVIAEQPNIPITEPPGAAAEAEGLDLWWMVIALIGGTLVLWGAAAILRTRRSGEAG